MDGTDTPVAVFALIRQFDLSRLIVVSKHIGIMFHFVDCGKLKSVTFKLNTDTHFLARVTTAHIASSTLDAASRGRGSNMSNEMFGCFWNGEALTPVFKSAVI